MRKRLLHKPLKDHLTGLSRKIDRINDTKITQAITDCIQFILVEVSRLDSEVC